LPKSRKPAGFGAGIAENDVGFDMPDDEMDARDDFSIVGEIDEEDVDVNEDVQDEDSEPKTRRKRGRGRRGENSDARSESSSTDRDRNADAEDSREVVASSGRITSWQDAIGTLVATNMENHQRNPNQGRGPRGAGRGPRRP